MIVQAKILSESKSSNTPLFTRGGRNVSKRSTGKLGRGLGGDGSQGDSNPRRPRLSFLLAPAKPLDDKSNALAGKAKASKDSEKRQGSRARLMRGTG